MPWEQTRVLDTFDRADGDPGTNWAQAVSAYTVPPIASNDLSWPQFPSLHWTTLGGRNQQAFAQPTTAVDVGFLLRWANPNTGNESGYIVYADNGGLNYAEAKLWTAGLGSEVSLGFENFVMDATDIFVGAQMVGSLLEVYGSPDGADWILRKTWLDSTFDRGGYFGLFNVNQSAGTKALGLFGGGTIFDPPSFGTPIRRSRRTSW